MNTYRFVMDAVSISAVLKLAFVDWWKLLNTFSRHAFTTERFETEAVFMDTVENEAFVDS